MTDYGKGAAVGAAAVFLPATSSVEMYFADKMHPWVLIGFFVLNTLWLVILVAQISRYYFNKQTK
jgi:hypothetical protein